MAIDFSVTSAGELVVSEERGVRWRGRPDGLAVRCVVQVSDHVDAIILLEPSADGAAPRFATLVRVDPDGRIVWRSAPPAAEDVDSALAGLVTEPSADGWVAARSERRGSISANSWSGFYCELDPMTGRITSAVFTK